MVKSNEARKLGLRAAIAELGEEALLEAFEEQLSLLPSKATQDMLADDKRAERRGPGRPAGSKNKSTDDWVRFISHNYRSPLLFLADSYTRPLAVLAAELGCDLLDAFKIQVAAAKELAPYLHQKQPVAVQIDASGVISLIIETGAPALADPQLGGGALVIDAEILGPSEDQENDDNSKG